jgi:hypothetical protein
VGADGALMLDPRPLAALGAAGTLDLRMKGFGWSGGDQVIAVPGARLQGELEAAEGHSVLRGNLKVDSARFALGARELYLADLDDDWEIKSADLAAGEVELEQRVRVGSARQSFAPGYPVGALSIVAKARRDREGTVRAPLVQVDNPAAGTSLTLSGRAEAGALRRAVSLRAELQQDLSRAWSERERFEGKGTLGVRLRVDSADLRTFRTRASARFTGAVLRLPKAGWAIESLDAEIPAEASVVAGAGGPALRFESGNSPFAQPSCTDQQPLQERRTFLSIARLTTPAGVVAPLAGNLEVSRGAVLLSQLELGVRKGLVTGQCELLFQGQEPTLVARVRASGVESSRGEPFDGNIAVSVSTRERRVEGRAEILRIGRRHLLDLLDIQDPYRADPSLNRIRTALALGYPEHVRLTFRQGFANLEAVRLDQPEKIRSLALDLPGLSAQPAFSPDGRFLYVTQFLDDTSRDGAIDGADNGVLFRVPWQGELPDAPERAAAAFPEQLTDGRRSCQYPAPAPGGLVATCARRDGLDVFTLPLEGEVPPAWTARRLWEEVDHASRHEDRLPRLDSTTNPPHRRRRPTPGSSSGRARSRVALLIKNIALLATQDDEARELSDAWILIEGPAIAGLGSGPSARSGSSRPWRTSRSRQACAARGPAASAVL